MGVRGSLGCNLVLVNVGARHSGCIKSSSFFHKGVSAADGSLDCESALQTRSGIMSSEMRWCAVCIYLTDARLLPHLRTGRWAGWHRSPTRLSHRNIHISALYLPVNVHTSRGLIYTLNLEFLFFFCTPPQISLDSDTWNKAVGVL